MTDRTPQPSEQPPGLWNELHRTLHEPGPTIVITKGQAAYLLERIARAEAAAPDPVASPTLDAQALGIALQWAVFGCDIEGTTCGHRERGIAFAEKALARLEGQPVAEERR